MFIIVYAAMPLFIDFYHLLSLFIALVPRQRWSCGSHPRQLGPWHTWQLQPFQNETPKGAILSDGLAGPQSKYTKDH
jgi:hypothetical protein